MPTYVYRCKACEHQFETVQRMSDDPLRECPECGKEIARLLFPVGIVFKGSGFHINDYPNSGSGKKEPASSTEAAKETASTKTD